TERKPQARQGTQKGKVCRAQKQQPSLEGKGTRAYADHAYAEHHGRLDPEGNGETASLGSCRSGPACQIGRGTPRWRRARVRGEE
ncbi:MAG: hypothetical protein ACK559_15855, partial [bacterium]